MTPTLTADRRPLRYLPRAAARPRSRLPVALIVGADQDFRFILDQLLAQIGYAVVSTDNVDDACRLASETLPTLVVSEIRIGLHDTRLIPIELRRLPALEWTPMVVSSTWDLPQDRTLAELVSAELFTSTPVDFRAIKALAAKLIQPPSRAAGAPTGVNTPARPT